MKLLQCMLCLLLALPATAQLSKDQEKLARAATRQKIAGIGDRAGGSHNKSNIGLFFENRGKLYPADIAQGVGGEWPLHSGHEYIYRANPVVGVPRNVVQGRFRGSEEWEAAPGYNFPGSAKIAFSDDPTGWPVTGWIVKNPDGSPKIVSDQDSYCAYHDSLNMRSMLQIQVDQIGYAFGAKMIRDMLFYTYKVINTSSRTLDSLYWGLYVDLDIGDVPGGEYEYADDKIGIDRNLDLVFFYDDGISPEWPGANTGYFGYTLVSAPDANGVKRGITDFHYSLYDDDSYLLQDTVHYGVLSSAASLYNSPTLGKKYFHPGANLPDLHFDDPATVRATGLDLVSNIGVGPYSLKPGDTLTFVTAFVAGYTLTDITTMAQRAHDLHVGGYLTPKAPDPPDIVVEPGDRKIRITWNNRSESSRNAVTGQPNFEGYRLYKSTDKGVHWDQFDRNTYPSLGPDAVPLAVYDRVNTLPPNKGLQYSYIDTTVVNGFEYWYTVTAYDNADSSVGTLESPKGTTAQSKNLGIATPRSAATGFVPVTFSPVTQVGTGTAQVTFTFQHAADPDAGAKTYDASFAPLALLEGGNTRSAIEVFLDTLQSNSAHAFGVTFLSPTQYRVRDLGTKAVLATGTYASGAPIRFAGLRLVLTDVATEPGLRPEAGDSVIVCPGIAMAASGTIVLPLRPFFYNTWYATTNGVVFQVSPADTIPSGAVNYGDRFRFTTEPARVDQARVSAGLDRVRVVPNPYMISSVFEIEYGVRGERREPIRQLKFNNLPPKCTITIYTMAGDLVATLYHESDNGTETWNMRSAGGREIAAGVYVYIVKTDTAQKIDRFAVIK